MKAFSSPGSRAPRRIVAIRSALGLYGIKVRHLSQLSNVSPSNDTGTREAQAVWAASALLAASAAWAISGIVTVWVVLVL